MRRWDSGLEKDCHSLVACICDATVPDEERSRAWRALLVQVSPHVEAWTASSPVLRRCRLASEDEVRSVLVDVLSRMSARGFENLRAHLARRPPEDEDDAEAALVEGVLRLCHPEDVDATPPPEVRDDDREGTPLRGWLRSLTRYAVKDHVKRRFGWSTSVRVSYGVEGPRSDAARTDLQGRVRAVRGVIAVELDEGALDLAVEYLPGSVRGDRIDAAIEGAGFRITAAPDLRRSKRDLCTGADRLDTASEPGARPPITDFLTVRSLLAEVSAFMTAFPSPMREAVGMWMEDEPFEAIAARLGLDGGEKARALVRAGLARLRERFRGRWPGIAED